MMDEIYHIPLFEDISEQELRWLLDHSYEMFLDQGGFFVQANEPSDRLYIVLEGELQVKRTVHGKDMVLGTTPRGIIGGEIGLLHGKPSDLTVQAIVPSHLLVFEQQAFFELFSACPTVGARILQTATERMHMFASLLQHQEKMAALGKLAAGLAHELNNPAAAAQRAAKMLSETLPVLHACTMKLNTLCASRALLDELLAFQQQVIAQAPTMPPLAPLEQSDREEEMSDWLAQHTISEPWEMASSFVAAGLTPDNLNTFVENLPTDSVDDVLLWLCESLNALNMLKEIEHSSRRISDIVSAVKGYTYLDQSVWVDVHIHTGLEDTLTILNHKLKHMTIIRDYDPNIPTIMARGTELNQVWTNLIDNAIDALQGQGTIWLKTRCENEYVMIEVADDGPGIPSEIVPRLFEPFFTTKDVGTGLGLDISYRIVHDHRGTIEVQSHPGCTRFIVRLPVENESTCA